MSGHLLGSVSYHWKPCSWLLPPWWILCCYMDLNCGLLLQQELRKDLSLYTCLGFGKLPQSSAPVKGLTLRMRRFELSIAPHLRALRLPAGAYDTCFIW